MFRTTKLDAGLAQSRPFRQVPVLHTVFWWPYKRLMAPRRLHASCLHSYRYRGPAPGVMVWAAIGYTTSTFLIRIDGNLNADRYISDIFRPVVVHYLRGLSNFILQQDNAWPHAACQVLSFFDTQGIRLLLWPARFPEMSLTEKTSAHGLLRNWLATPFQLIWLMKCGIDLKQHGMSYPVLSSKPCSTPCLIRYRPF